jgi:hypothetical protein
MNLILAIIGAMVVLFAVAMLVGFVLGRLGEVDE